MQNFYAVDAEQKKFFIKHVWELAGKKSFKPTDVLFMEDSDKNLYAITFIANNIGGLQYVIEGNQIYTNVYSDAECKRILQTEELLKALGQHSGTLPHRIYYDMVEIFKNM